MTWEISTFLHERVGTALTNLVFRALLHRVSEHPTQKVSFPPSLLQSTLLYEIQFANRVLIDSIEISL